MHKNRRDEIIVLLMNMSDPMTAVDWDIMSNVGYEMLDECEERDKGLLLAECKTILEEDE